MASNDEPWLGWIVKAVGPFGFFALVTFLVLAFTGMVLCVKAKNRKALLIYLVLAQLPLLLCVVGALRNWFEVHRVIERMDVVLKPSEWTDLWKELGALILWGLGCSIPLNLLGLIGLRRHRPNRSPGRP